MKQERDDDVWNDVTKRAVARLPRTLLRVYVPSPNKFTASIVTCIIVCKYIHGHMMLLFVISFTNLLKIWRDPGTGGLPAERKEGNTSTYAAYEGWPDYL